PPWPLPRRRPRPAPHGPSPLPVPGPLPSGPVPSPRGMFFSFSCCLKNASHAIGASDPAGTVRPFLTWLGWQSHHATVRPGNAPMSNALPRWARPPLATGRPCNVPPLRPLSR
ncbi:MAG TPA: hypothetical protein EYP56_10040, partial [Planctomycetaceae bacterium]|nr:hypothetical protein [Planctomycetaceae bacterium]